MLPRFPLYIVSKGRWDTRLTVKALDEMSCPYLIVVEEQEQPSYAQVIPEDRILVLPKHYQEDYDTFDDLGLSKSPGPGPARNFAWDHALEQGHEWHWVMDDNIRHFYRYNRNRFAHAWDPVIFRVMEDFALRYTNLAMAGPNYELFIARTSRYRPFVLNTRIYSCNLIRNDVPYRWRGRYNEDTDLSLRMLKGGWCTVLFNAFLQGKLGTQKLKGGNTTEFYDPEGTLPKSQMLVHMHPDVARLTTRYGRAHHHVDYRPWKAQGLIRKPDLELPDEPNEYGMKVIPR